MRFIRFGYSVLFYCLTPILLLRLWLKSLSLPAYRQRIAERFCWDAMSPQCIDVWIHAVSLGEVIAVIDLIERLLASNRRVLVTTMTPTGSERIQRQFGARVQHRYVPYEQPAALKRFFKYYQPRLGIILETELWPNLIHYAYIAQIPLVLFNACLSSKSAKGYRRFAWIFKPLLNQFAGIYTQTAEDAARFSVIGVEPEKIHITGNLKFDSQIQLPHRESLKQLKVLWGDERVVLMVASTHDNEELQILRQLRKLQRVCPHIMMLIAPRHPERFAKVAQLSKELGFITGLRSDLSSINQQNEVLILDSMGELMGFYPLSDFAFVGGSLVPIHGHNILEPIAANALVIVGPYVENIQSTCDDLLAVKGLVQITNASELPECLQYLMDNPQEKTQIQSAAKTILEKNQGALQRYVSVIDAMLNKKA